MSDTSSSPIDPSKALDSAGFMSKLIDIPPSELDPDCKVRIMAHHRASSKQSNSSVILLLHGHPQSSLIWLELAPKLVEHGYDVVVMDLRGHGGSDAPPVQSKSEELDLDVTKWRYSKREMARDAVHVMKHYGFDKFNVLAHDRGARVAHRLALDHPDVVERMMLLDIAPTIDMYGRTDVNFATYYWHWFFLIQPFPLAEDLLAASPATYIKLQVDRPTGGTLPASALATYAAHLGNPAQLHATCEDYRASGPNGVDSELDREDRENGVKVKAPVRVLWGERGVIEMLFDGGLELWKAQCENVTGASVDCSHYIPEEAPDVLLKEALAFFTSSAKM